MEHTRLRRRIVYSMHQSDVEDRIYRALGGTRSTALRIVDMTANPAWYVFGQLAGLYREIPEVMPPVGGEDTAAAILEAGWWQLAARNQRDVLALNDGFVRVDLDEDNEGAPSFRLVPPDLAEVVTNPLAPSQPLALREWITDPDDPSKWVLLDCDPRSRTYRALAEDRKTDVSVRVLGGNFSGDAYPFLVGGAPVLPYVAYHAAETGYALDPYTGREVFEGALQLGVYYSFGGHALRQGSWAQRWILGAEPTGGEPDESGRRRDVVADPATALVFKPTDETQGQAQVGQWSAPVDPDRFFAAVERYERRLVEMALSNAGVSRRESDVRSAMSLAVSRDAQRDAQRSYEPVFRRSDVRLCRLVAGLRGEPTDGWRITYRSLPRDPMELAAEMDRMERLISAGLLDKVSAYKQLHPGLTDSEAEAAVKQIGETNRRLGGEAPKVDTQTPDAAPTPVAALPTITLTSTDIASIVTVDEARASQGLPPIGGPEGALTVAEYQARNAAVIAAAANATAGDAKPNPREDTPQ